MQEQGAVLVVQRSATMRGNPRKSTVQGMLTVVVIDLPRQQEI